MHMPSKEFCPPLFFIRHMLLRSLFIAHFFPLLFERLTVFMSTNYYIQFVVFLLQLTWCLLHTHKRICQRKSEQIDLLTRKLDSCTYFDSVSLSYSIQVALQHSYISLQLMQIQLVIKVLEMSPISRSHFI